MGIAHDREPMEMEVLRNAADAPPVLVQGLDLAELVLAQFGRSIDMSLGQGRWRHRWRQRGTCRASTGSASWRAAVRRSAVCRCDLPPLGKPLDHVGVAQSGADVPAHSQRNDVV